MSNKLKGKKKRTNDNDNYKLCRTKDLLKSINSRLINIFSTENEGIVMRLDINHAINPWPRDQSLGRLLLPGAN